MKDFEPKIEYVATSELTDHEKNSKLHPEKQIEMLMKSIKDYGFNVPLLIYGEDNKIVAGHGRLIAAKRLGIESLPCIRVDHLSEDERRAALLVLNSTNLSTGLDLRILNIELDGLKEVGFDFGSFGLSLDVFEPPKAPVEDRWKNERVFCCPACKHNFSKKNSNLKEEE
jgi:hypothetical protein